MSFIKSLAFNIPKSNPWPFSIDGIRNLKKLQLDSQINFIIGDNGTGKSTVLETLAYRLQLPLIDGLIAGKSGLDAAKKLQPYFEIEWNIERTKGFFFRAEDFSSFIGSVDRANASFEAYLGEMRDEIPDDVIKSMSESNNYALSDMRKVYGQNLESMSHGEAYLHIMKERVKGDGIYLLDEPEAALSPANQLSLIYFILNHLEYSRSQFIIATHAPILMSIPNAKLFEIQQDSFDEVELNDCNHFHLTKSFLNNPDVFLNQLKM